MIKSLLVLVFILTTIFNGVCQQAPLLTNFMFHRFNFNPGATGIDDGISGAMIYRNQWDKITGAPNTAFFNVEANLNKFAVGGAGITFMHDVIGSYKTNNVTLNYSYPFQIGEVGMINVGLGLGIINFSNNPDYITPTLNNNDAALIKPGSGSAMNMNFGVCWKSFKGLYSGISVTNLNKPVIRSMNSFQMYRTYYLMSGYKFSNILGQGRDIECQLLVRSDILKTSADLNALYYHSNLFYAGLTYRTTESICFLAGFYPLKNTTIGYAYDLTINGLNTVSRGTNEIVLKYKYIIPEPPLEKSKHPRWL